MRKKIIIDGKETRYSVTDDAHIYNDETGKELKGTYATNEYHSVQLMIDGKPKTFMFHRLVAQAFCENPNNYTIVDHIDRNKRNDNASNLRWVTTKENNLNRESGQIKKSKYLESFDETWIPVYSHEQNYRINVEGEVVNYTTKKILSQQDRHGYKRVLLNGSLFSVHILVWESFNKQKVPKDMQVDHIDGNKANNNLSNLQVVTRTENMKNSYKNGHKGQVAIKQYSLDGEYIKTYSTIREAALSMNVSEPAIRTASIEYYSSAGYYWLRESDKTTIEEVLYGWVPEGYKIIEKFPTYCINKEGDVYNKRNKKSLIRKFRASSNEPYVIIKGCRINIKDLLEQNFNLDPKNSLTAGNSL